MRGKTNMMWSKTRAGASRGRPAAPPTTRTPCSGNHLSGAQQALDLITAKCKELGLKISAEKSRAMAIKTDNPANQLRVQGIRLAWTGCYQYLWLDSQLSFAAQLTYLRERTQTRLNVMRAMTRPGTGATYDVLHLYYVQAVCSLVDYSMPVLTSLSSSQWTHLEVVQNSAMRTMLGAPRWCSACGVMHCETRLVPLTTRIDYIATCHVARTLHRNAEDLVQRRLRMAMAQGSECLRGNPWLANTTQAASILGYVESWPWQWQKADVPAPILPQPAPVGTTRRRGHCHIPTSQQGPLHLPGDEAASSYGHGGGHGAGQCSVLH